jgi:hypothetical protein
MKSLLKTIISIVLVGLCAYGLIAGSSLWVFSKPTIKLGEVISIAVPESNTNTSDKKLQNATVILLSGWAYPEAWGAWSTSNAASLSLPKPPSKAKSLLVDARALVSKKHPEQMVKVMINGQLRSTSTLIQEDGNQIIIPLEVTDFSNSRLVVELQLPNLVSPSSLGMGNDDRKLAIGLKTARFE